MKRTVLITAAAILMIAFTSNIFAKGNSEEKKNQIPKSAVLSLLMGLESDNYGLKTSAAFMLGELEVKEAVIPLMRMMHSEKNENARIVAALALYKIGDAVGLYSVKEQGRFDRSERVRKMCANFYNEHLQKAVLTNVAIAFASF